MDVVSTDQAPQQRTAIPGCAERKPGFRVRHHIVQVESGTRGRRFCCIDAADNAELGRRLDASGTSFDRVLKTTLILARRAQKRSG